MSLKKPVLLIVSSIIVTAAISATAKARSVYVISDVGDPPSNPKIHAYRIQDSNLIYQTEYESRHPLAVGLAIDADSEFLFITYEYAYPQNPGNQIEIVNAKTMQYVDTVTFSGVVYDLAGIVVDQGKQKVYAVDRRTPNLYVYSWYPRIPKLVLDEQIELEGLIYGDVGGAWGLSLDEENGRLWV